MTAYVDLPAKIVLKGDVVWVSLTETGENGIAKPVIEFVMPWCAFTASLKNALGIKSAMDKRQAEAAIAMLPKRRKIGTA